MQYGVQKRISQMVFTSMVVMCVSLFSQAHAVVLSFNDLPLFDGQPHIVTRTQLYGLWGMKQPQTSCIEYYNFKDNGAVTINSGAEDSVGKYQYAARENDDDKLGFLYLGIDDENLKPDCTGSNVDQRGDVSVFFIQWKDNNAMKFCLDKQGLNCMSTLERILP